LIGDVKGDLDREAGLSHTAHSDQAYDALVLEQRSQFGAFVVSPDEA
jgi:hypothetical protein